MTPTHKDESFVLSFPPVRGVHPSLMLKVAVVHAYGDHDDALFDSLVDDEIARDIDTGHAQFAAHVMSTTISHLNDAVQCFQLVLDQRLVDYSDHATALTIALQRN
ncbi:hypothetical protein EDB19DRAFT_1914829 [Suillus lakei]|nr:hypothetical protein EDB19DRAFT_1914829 [Suillus lakei]